MYFREVFDPAEWDAAVMALGGNIAQSWGWGLLHQRQGWEPVRLLGEGGRGAVQLLLKHAPPGGGSVAYAPYGPLAASVADLAEVTESAARWARGRGAYLLKIEPRAVGVEAARQVLGTGSYVQAPRELPARTWIVGLPEDSEEHFKALPKDARYGIRRARREGVEVLTLSHGNADTDVEMGEFLKLLKVTAERHDFHTASEEFYRDVMRDLHAHLLLAHHRGTPLAGAIIATFGEEAYYFFGASDVDRGRMHAPYLLQWEAMEVARRAGCSRYDMWGMPTRAGSRSKGFARFKQKFGGTVEEYAGAYFRVLRHFDLLKRGAMPLVARGARFAVKGCPGARKPQGKVSVHRDTGDSPEEQAGGRRSIKQLGTLGVYHFTSGAYAWAFASDSAKAFGGFEPKLPAPFLGKRHHSHPPNVIAAHRQDADA